MAWVAGVLFTKAREALKGWSGEKRKKKTSRAQSFETETAFQL